ncbi:unnamed protein product [Chrysoparadoxa australica]
MLEDLERHLYWTVVQYLDGTSVMRLSATSKLSLEWTCQCAKALYFSGKDCQLRAHMARFTKVLELHAVVPVALASELHRKSASLPLVRMRVEAGALLPLCSQEDMNQLAEGLAEFVLGHCKSAGGSTPTIKHFSLRAVLPALGNFSMLPSFSAPGAASFWSSLESLELSHLHINNVIMTSLLQCLRAGAREVAPPGTTPVLPMQHFSVQGNLLGKIHGVEPALLTLASDMEAGLFANLEVLNLGENFLDEELGARLSLALSRGACPKLRVLQLQRGMVQLTALNMRYSRLLKAMPKLVTLGIGMRSSCAFVEAPAALLKTIADGALSQITDLTISGIGSARSLIALVESVASGGCPNLNSLTIMAPVLMQSSHKVLPCAQALYRLVAGDTLPAMQTCRVLSSKASSHILRATISKMSRVRSQRIRELLSGEDSLRCLLFPHTQEPEWDMYRVLNDRKLQMVV